MMQRRYVPSAHHPTANPSSPCGDGKGYFRTPSANYGRTPSPLAMGARPQAMGNGCPQLVTAQLVTVAGITPCYPILNPQQAGPQQGYICMPMPTVVRPMY